MSPADLKSAITGITISHMERYNGPPFAAVHGEQLYKELRADMFNMYAAWWNVHFPYFKYDIIINLVATTEPTVKVKWTENGNIINNWRSLTFTFNPAQVEECEDDPYAAYKRAMSVI